MTQDFCDCGSQRRYQDCCQPLHTRRSAARTPEQLMRSRYSAYCRGIIDYLIATHHPSQRALDDGKRLASTVNQTDWASLRIIAAEPTNGDTGYVEFVAFYRSRGPNREEYAQLHEKSRFVKENGRWYYVDGIHLPPIQLGRNEPCWCGSGKRYKKCHG